MLRRLFQIFSQNNLTALLIFAGTFVWSLTMVKSGFPRSYGFGFWGPNGHDGIWHIALAETLARGKWEIPTFAGPPLQNYHIGFDLLLALINKLTNIPISYLYFQMIPPLLAFLIGLLTYKFVYIWTKSKNSAIWSLFFIYFGGSFGWIVSLFRSGEIGGESMFWSQQAISTLINPPFALSLVFILFGLTELVKKTKKPLDYVLCILCFGLLIQVKVYAGILVLGALFVSGLYSYFLNRRSYILKVWLGSLAVSLPIFLTLNKGSQNLIIYQPFWFLETMMGFSDRLGWERFYSAMTSYRSGSVWVKEILAYSVAFLIFWYGNIGTRLAKEVLIFKWVKNIRKLTWIEIFIVMVIVVGGIIPIFFLQKGTPWNTIQFFYYSLFFSGILAGVAMPELGKLFKKSTVQAIKVLIIILTVPTTLGTLRHYLPSRPPAMLSGEEQEALKFLSKQPDGIVLTYPFDSQKAKEAESNPPRPLYLYESTAYVSAFSKKSTFLEDQINLEITGYDWKERREKVEDFFMSVNLIDAVGFLKQNKITYIYLTEDQKANFDERQLGIKKIFENRQTKVFKVE